jgi:hypothetical protein
MNTSTLANEIAALERQIKSAPNATAKKALESKIAVKKAEMKSGKTETANSLATKLLKAKGKVKELSSKDFNDMIKRLSQKPEYKFLKSMSREEINRDIQRPAKPLGWRFKGKNSAKPTKTQIATGRKNGTVYFEDRKNRSDISRVAQLAKGGGVYSSEDRWVVTFQNQDSGEFEKVIVRANNKKSAISIAEDESGFDSDWEYYSAEKQMAKGGEIKVINISDDDKLNYFIKKQDRKNNDYSYIKDMLTTTYNGKKFYSLGYDTVSGGHSFSLEEAKKNARVIIDSQLGKKWDVIIKEVGGNFGEQDFTKKTYVVMTSPLFPKEMLREMRNSLEYADGGMMAKGGGVAKAKSYLHLYKLTYPNGQYIVESYDGKAMTPKEALEKMRISLRGLKSYKYSGASSDSDNYKKWYLKKDIGYSDTEAWDEVFGSEKYATGGGVGEEILDDLKYDSFAKGGNIPSIARKVDEVNALIKRANELNLTIVDESGTWQSPMKYKPFKYSNGTLYEEYEQLDLYKYNKGKGEAWETKKYKVLKNRMEFDSPLNDVARRYRKALKHYDNYGYAQGGNMGGEQHRNTKK